MTGDGLLAVGHQRADHGGRQAKMRHPVALHDLPQPVRPGVVRHAFVDHERRAEQQRSADRPGTHHPAEVGEPEERLVRSQVETVGQVLGALDREAPVDVDRAFRPAGRARCVQDHVGRFGVGLRGMRQRDDRFVGHLLVPPQVPTLHPWRRLRAGSVAKPAHHQHSLDGGSACGRLIGRLLEPDDGTAAQEPIRRDEQLGLAIGQAAGRGRTGVAREDRRVDGLHAPEREHGDHGLQEQWEEDPDAIAFADTQLCQHAGGSIDLFLQLRVGQAADVAVLALPADGHFRGMGRGAAVNGCGRVVERATTPPARPLHPAAEIKDLRRRPLPIQVQVLRRRAPEPGRIALGALLQRREVALAGVLQEPGKAAFQHVL